LTHRPFAVGGLIACCGAPLRRWERRVCPNGACPEAKGARGSTMVPWRLVGGEWRSALRGAVVVGGGGLPLSVR